MNILHIKNLTKRYGTGDACVQALDKVNFTVQEAEFVAIIGTSGSGKSTLLHMLGGLDRPTSGEVIVSGQNIFGMKEDELTLYRRRNIGFIFQNYNLVPILNVYENIVLPIQLDGKEPDHEWVERIVKILGIENKLYQMPNTLSGGQQQRVAIARALITKPALILADEPTGNLDSNTTREVMELIQEANRKFHQTIIMITHNDEIAQKANRIVRIEDGKMVGGEDHER